MLIHLFRQKEITLVQILHSESQVIIPRQSQNQHQVDDSAQVTQQTQPQSPTLTENCTKEIVNIMQKQNDITTLLVKQNLSSVLPARNIPMFDGDPLQYR